MSFIPQLHKAVLMALTAWSAGDCYERGRMLLAVTFGVLCLLVVFQNVIAERANRGRGGS